MQAAVNPVDAEIGEHDEQRELQDAVVGKWLIGERIIELCVTADFGDQEGSRQQRHNRHGAHSLGDFHRNLILEILGVMDGRLIPDEDVRQACGNKVDDNTKNPNSDARNLLAKGELTALERNGCTHTRRSERN